MIIPGHLLSLDSQTVFVALDSNIPGKGVMA
jgi:hypothetical protein